MISSIILSYFLIVNCVSDFFNNLCHRLSGFSCQIDTLTCTIAGVGLVADYKLTFISYSDVKQKCGLRTGVKTKTVFNSST